MQIRRTEEFTVWLGGLRDKQRSDEMAIKTKLYDAAEFLTDPEVIAAYLTEALDSDDPR